MSTRTTAPPPHAEFFPPPPDGTPVRWVAGLRDDFRELRRFWPVVLNMVSQDLRVRYQRSVLGFLWTLLNPILMMATLTFFFAKLFGQNDWRAYSIYLFAGMVPWGLLANTLNDCSFCIIANEGLIRKIYLPKMVFPLTRLLVSLTTFCLSLVAMFLLLIPFGVKFTPPLVLIPVVVALFAMFSLGIGLIVATTNTFYRDFSHLVGVFLQAWYFATPIMWDPTKMDLAPWKLWINPAYPFIRLFQVIISDHRWPDPMMFGLAAVIAAVALGVGYAAFKSYEDKLVFRL